MDTKQCRKCGEIRNLDRGRAQCRLCVQAKATIKMRAWSRLNRERLNSRRRTRYKKHKQRIRILANARSRARYKANKDNVLARNKKWKDANREQILIRRRVRRSEDRKRILAQNRTWYQINRERVLTRQRAWRRANPDKIRNIDRAARIRRRASKRGVTSTKITPMMIAAIYQAQGGLCYYGREELNGFYHLEHKIPLIRGGSHTLDNLVLACATCNRRKFTKTDIEFLAGG